jgi:hypothetical protein
MSNIRKIVVVALLLTGVACARPTRDRASALVATMPFPDRNGHVFLPVTLPNRPPALWNLDSGFETSAIDDRTRERAGISAHGRAKADAPGGAIEQASTDRLCVTVGATPFCAHQMASIPLDGLAYLIGDEFPGILGHDFFERYVVRIDYRQRTVSLFDPARFEPPGAAVSVPVYLEQGEPFLVGTLFVGGRATPAKLKVDTGSLDFMGLNGSFVAQTSLLPAGHLRRPAPGIAVGGSTENWVTRLDSVVIAGLPPFLHPPVGYSASLERVGDAGTIGAGLLARFIVTFDYRRHRLLFEAAEPSSTPISSDASGALVGAPDSARRARVVAAVAAGSPADVAGLRVGDSIVAIDGRAAETLDLSAVRRMFERPDVAYDLTVATGASRRSIVLRTSPWP